MSIVNKILNNLSIFDNTSSENLFGFLVNNYLN